MKSTDAPRKQPVPFGTNGPREDITATTPAGSNQASYDKGFPPITMTLKSAGGLPPKGQDMNQILFELSSLSRYFAAGGGYVYDSSFSTSIGGYPLSAKIPNSTGTGFWFNTVEDNQTNPENSTAALTGWIPVGSYGTTSISGLSATSITLTTLQASKDRLVFSGTLTGNISVVVPAWIKKWTVVNNCNGSFSLTIKTPSGSGVVIPNSLTAEVYGNGTSIVQDSAIYGLPGRLIGNGPVLITKSGIYTPSPGTRYIIVEMVGASGGSGGTSATSSGTTVITSPSCQGTYAMFVYLNPAAQAVTIGKGGNAGPAGGGNGSTGGNSSFGSLVTCPGGQGSYGAQASSGVILPATGSPSVAPTVSDGVTLLSSIFGRSPPNALQVSTGVATNYASHAQGPMPGMRAGASTDGSYRPINSDAFAGNPGFDGACRIWEYT